jgi:hypothetical protein
MKLQTQTMRTIHHEGRRGKPLNVHLQVKRRSLIFCVEGWYGRDGGWYWARRWSRPA